MKHLLTVLLLVLLASCGGTSNEQKTRKRATAKAQSAPYELLLVTNKEWLATPTGTMLYDLVTTPIEGLPQVEPCFKVTSINEAGFNATFRSYAMIVMTHLGSRYPEPKVEIERDVYCQPQIITHIYAPTNETFAELIQQHGEQILTLYNEHEFDRERRLLKRQYSGIVQKATRSMFGVDILVPKDIDELKRGESFIWGTAGKQEFRTNVCLYSLPLADYSLAQFVAARDSVMQINIPGGREDQWMQTVAETVTCGIYADTTATSSPTVVVRGLWAMRNDAMGGPFVCYLYRDDARNRIVVAEGFVFAPEEKKRPVIRQLEAGLQTFRFASDAK